MSSPGTSPPHVPLLRGQPLTARAVVPGATGEDLPTWLGARGTEMSMTQILPSSDSRCGGGNWGNVHEGWNCAVHDKGVLVCWEC